MLPANFSCVQTRTCYSGKPKHIMFPQVQKLQLTSHIDPYGVQDISFRISAFLEQTWSYGSVIYLKVRCALFCHVTLAFPSDQLCTKSRFSLGACRIDQVTITTRKIFPHPVAMTTYLTPDAFIRLNSHHSFTSRKRNRT